MLERYVYCGAQRLRCGYTTGSCAAAAAKAAVRMLLTGCAPIESVIETPGGVRLALPVEAASFDGKTARCAVRKDAGDDADATDGLLIFACVTAEPDGKITIDGGNGVGRVTRPGLDQPPGAAAINRVPREMIARAAREALGDCGMETGLRVVIEVPQGEQIAARTFNPRLGIVGGISILGTTGIVEPMSETALVETIRTELGVRYAAGNGPVLLTPGNYGETFAQRALRLDLSRSVLCSNYIGEAIDHAVRLRFSGILLVGHIGKLVKLAGGIFETHSRVADARMEILTAYAARAGADRLLVKRLLDCATTDEALGLLEAGGVLNDTVRFILQRIEFHLERRAGGIPVGAVLFSNPRGVLGQTTGAAALLEKLRQTEEPI
ncbi:cobalamin biosynthesis protein CbiD [Anaerotruncus sp. AF02-27]|uniref:cobalt-precorrin-5B (C(1))-methyltransferase CbiD n=1 Tax=Anaerotruncus TaxID=244127 RepID=UPI000E5340E0|nr:MULTISPECIES: cobalt-precorrin-5B (C(1))-methyltransferase CbiD [Anaerotruncus]RGX55967.1 cobalamin biosynthesis protein CbiD [Anaerotruncus sp. AF02-27]